jgi:hypothetical protein
LIYFRAKNILKSNNYHIFKYLKTTWKRLKKKERNWHRIRMCSNLLNNVRGVRRSLRLVTMRCFFLFFSFLFFFFFSLIYKISHYALLFSVFLFLFFFDFFWSIFFLVSLFVLIYWVIILSWHESQVWHVNSVNSIFFS